MCMQKFPTSFPSFYGDTAQFGDLFPISEAVGPARAILFLLIFERGEPANRRISTPGQGVERLSSGFFRRLGWPGVAGDAMLCA